MLYVPTPETIRRLLFGRGPNKVIEMACFDTNVQLLVFSVTPFKINQNQNQIHSTDKVQNLGNERG